MKNGLYVLEISMLDGVVGVNRGVMELFDGEIRGGDPYFYYVGSYSFAGGYWRGELVTGNTPRIWVRGRSSAARKSASGSTGRMTTTAPKAS